jgi:hypothetical protein
MARRKSSGEFELMLVSFCDIITIALSALLFSTIMVVFNAIKVPVLRPTPMAKPAEGKVPIFVECRENQLFFLEKDKIDAAVEKIMASIPPGRTGDIENFVRALKEYDVGTDYYTIDPRYLLVGKVALLPRPGIQGETLNDIKNPFGKYQIFLNAIAKQPVYIAFLVRDDSFPVYREARKAAIDRGIDTGIELLDIGEPIQFGIGGTAIKTL